MFNVAKHTKLNHVFHYTKIKNLAVRVTRELRVAALGFWFGAVKRKLFIGLIQSFVRSRRFGVARIRTFEPVKDLIIMNYLVRNEIIGNSKGGKNWILEYL